MAFARLENPAVVRYLRKPIALIHLDLPEVVKHEEVLMAELWVNVFK